MKFANRQMQNSRAPWALLLRLASIAVLVLAFAGLASAQMTVTTATLPNGAVGTAYAPQALQASGATPDSWAVTAGALPPGLQLNVNGFGVIDGTPTTPGTFNFTVSVRDGLAP